MLIRGQLGRGDLGRNEGVGDELDGEGHRLKIVRRGVVEVGGRGVVIGGPDTGFKCTACIRTSNAASPYSYRVEQRLGAGLPPERENQLVNPFGGGAAGVEAEIGPYAYPEVVSVPRLGVDPDSVGCDPVEWGGP